MGCDCGCGGTCPMCAPRLAREMFDHAYEITQAARQQVDVDASQRKTDGKGKKRKEKRRGKAKVSSN